jgi:hypothetical protein
MDYVQLKLLTGETIIGILTDTTDHSLDVACPMLVKYHTVLVPPSKTVEHLTASPYMRLTDDLYFRLSADHVVAMQPLNTQGINIFINLVGEHHDTEQLQEAGVYDFIGEKLEYLAQEKRKIESLDDDRDSALDAIKKLIESRMKKDQASEQEPVPEDLSKDRIIH